jgi:cold shock protein
MDRATGTVKWFSQEKGFGFIQREDGPDVFVHFSSIQSRGFRTLEQGEPVEFEILEEPKGLKAQNVVRLSPPAAPAMADAPRESSYRAGGYGAPAADGWDRGREERPSRSREWDRGQPWSRED